MFQKHTIFQWRVHARRAQREGRGPLHRADRVREEGSTG